jgi:hypothetical protein
VETPLAVLIISTSSVFTGRCPASATFPSRGRLLGCVSSKFTFEIPQEFLPQCSEGTHHALKAHII